MVVSPTPEGAGDLAASAGRRACAASRATWESALSTGWQAVKISRNRSSRDTGVEHIVHVAIGSPGPDPPQLVRRAGEFAVIGLLPAVPVDGNVFGGGHQPGGRPIGDPVDRPLPQGDLEGVLCHVLGGGEVAGDAGQRRDEAAGFDPPDRLDRGDRCGRVHPRGFLRYAPKTARTSASPSQPGHRSRCALQEPVGPLERVLLGAYVVDGVADQLLGLGERTVGSGQFDRAVRLTRVPAALGCRPWVSTRTPAVWPPRPGP